MGPRARPLRLLQLFGGMVAGMEVTKLRRAFRPVPHSDRRGRPRRLHLGCGACYIPGFCQIDLTPREHIDHVGRIERLDFIKSKIGVEVSFNHAEAIAWTFVRLNLAGESTLIKTESIVDVGVAIFATKEFKRWGRMDSAVGTFEQAKSWLEMMKPVLPIPILLLGLDPGWPDVQVFRGTSSN